MEFDPDNTNAQTRLLVFAAVMLTLLLLLISRLWVVQVHQGVQHVQAVAQQSVRRIRVEPVRGRMFDRSGNLLVDNQARFNVVFMVSEMRQPGARRKTVNHIIETAAHLAQLLDRDVALARERVERHISVYPALAMLVFEDLSTVELARLEELLPPIVGVEVVTEITRRYPHPGLAAHVLGFAGRRPPSDTFMLRQYSYVRPELEGRAGLEQQYNTALAGRGGSRLVRVNPLGFVHEQIGSGKDPHDGNDLVLTLDLKAQRAAEQVLAGYSGALVAVDVRNGAILAMASTPSYDLATLTSQRYSELARNTMTRPLINRALSAGYLPGSILKPLIAIASLENGDGDADEHIYCSGRYRFGSGGIRCWRRVGHGPLDLLGAIEQSCNIYFIELGQRTGLDQIRPFLLSSGLGQAPRIDLAGAGAGLCPSRQWALQHYQRNWIAIDSGYLSIGQGSVNLSPLQAAMFTAAIANGGSVYRPYLVQQIRSPQAMVVQNTPPQIDYRIPASAATFAVIREGMRLVVNGDRATAAVARLQSISLAGKTGTAEVGAGDNRHKNAWFIAFGPVEDPQYAVACVIEHGDSGGQTAAPLVARFFETWLRPEPL